MFKIPRIALFIFSLLLTLQIDAQLILTDSLAGFENHSFFGASVSISGDRMAVGSPRDHTQGFHAGRVDIYEWDGTDWILMGNPLYAQGERELFGNNLKLEGNRLAVVAATNTEAIDPVGYVQVFDWDGQAWMPLGDPMYADTAVQEFFGTSIDLRGNRIAFTYPNTETPPVVYSSTVYEWNGTDWNQLGTPLLSGNTKTNLALTDNLLIVSAPSINQNFPETWGGGVYTFAFDGTDWMGIDTLRGPHGSQYGYALETDGDLLAVSAWGQTGSNGFVEFREWNGSNWDQIGDQLTGSNGSTGFGFQLAIEEDVLAVGSAEEIFNDGNPATVRVYKRTGDSWDERGQFSYVTQTQQYTALEISQETVAIGLALNNQNRGFVRLYDLSGVTSNHSFTVHPLSVYPNPTTGQLQVTLPESTTGTLRVFDAFGRLERQLPVRGQTLDIDLTASGTGTYLVQISSGSQIYQTSIVVTR